MTSKSDIETTMMRATMVGYVCIFRINSNKDSDANVSTTEPKQQRLDEEFGEKYDKQSSLKVVDKLNPSKELNKEKGELQHAQE